MATKKTDIDGKPKLTREEVSEEMRRRIMMRWRDKTKVTPATLELVKHACAEGATVLNICAVLEITTNTFYRWMDTVPEFAKAVKDGRGIEHDRLVNKLVAMALDGNIAALIYALKARHGMLDNQVNHVIENKVAITFSVPDSMKPEQYLQTLAVNSEVIAPGDARRALAQPGVKGKVLRQLAGKEGVDDAG